MCVHVNVYVCMCACMHVCKYACVHTCVCMHMYVHACVVLSVHGFRNVSWELQAVVNHLMWVLGTVLWNSVSVFNFGVISSVPWLFLCFKCLYLGTKLDSENSPEEYFHNIQVFFQTGTVCHSGRSERTPLENTIISNCLSVRSPLYKI